MKSAQVARLLAYVSGCVNQQLLLQNEYLVAENRILLSHLPTRVRLTNSQRLTLAQNRQATRPEGAEPDRLGCETRNHPGLVSKAHCEEVGWFQPPQLP